MMNLTYLYQLFPNPQKRTRFIKNCALTFGLSLETLSKLLKKDPKKIYIEFIYEDCYMAEPLNVLFRMGSTVQEEAQAAFLNFFDNLVKAAKSKDKEQINKVLEVTKDTEAMKIKSRTTKGTINLTDAEILTILKYQMKYLLSVKKIEVIFKVHHKAYVARVLELKPMNHDLVSQFEALEALFSEYNFKQRSF